MTQNKDSIFKQEILKAINFKPNLNYYDNKLVDFLWLDIEDGELCAIASFLNKNKTFTSYDLVAIPCADDKNLFDIKLYRQTDECPASDGHLTLLLLEITKNQDALKSKPKL